MKTSTIVTTLYRSPAGELLIGSLCERLCLCDWLSRRDRDAVGRRICRYLGAEYTEGESVVNKRAIAQLEEYFAGIRREFDIALLMAGTDFQRHVWSQLCRIPYGSVTTYAGVARQADHPGGVRAVAAAIGANAISIFIPCHRVIGSGGRLTGYAGGIETKQRLLNLEGAGSLTW